MEKFFRTIFLLSAVGFILALLEFTTWGRQTNIAAWLFFYLPLLWFLWLVSVISPKWNPSEKELWTLWWAIDLVIFTLFCALSANIDHWANSRGLEIGTLIIYFPVIMPTVLLLSLLPQMTSGSVEEWLIELLCEGVGDGIVVWVSFSFIAAIQSFVILKLSMKCRKRSSMKKSDLTV